MSILSDASHERNGRSQRPITVAINGEKYVIDSIDPSMTLNEYLRLHTPYKGTKLACGEGGCGACVVSVARYDPRRRRVEERSLNSCLALLRSLHGCAVTTTEGLGTRGGPQGLHAVQQRLAGFHASQCGFCTPGMAMALYTTLRRAHQDSINEGAGGTQGEEARQSGGAEGQDGHVVPSGPLASLPNLTAAEAEAAIAGNICRCTGYRPILDACKSFAGGSLDVEDLGQLGLNVFWDQEGSQPPDAGKLPPYDPSKDPKFPDFLIQEQEAREKSRPNGDVHCSLTVGERAPDGSLERPGSDSANGHAGSSVPRTVTNGSSQRTGAGGLGASLAEDSRGHANAAGEKLWHTPQSLSEVFSLLEQHSNGSEAVKLVVGNTMAGIYKHIRPSIYIDIQEVPDLTAVECQPGGVSVGAAVTLTDLMAALRGVSSPVYPALVEHLQKVASPHVRNVASVAGNLVMAQQHGFESDLATILLGAGAQIRLASGAKGETTLSLEEFLAMGKLEYGTVVQSVFIPSWASNRPGEGQPPHGSEGNVVFKTYRAAVRPAGNAHAYVNAAFLLELDAPRCAGGLLPNGSEPEVGHEDPNGARHDQGADMNDGQSAHGLHIKSARIVFGAYGRKHATRARQVEKVLVGKPMTGGTILEAVKAVKEDVVPPPGTRKAAYRSSVAVGFLYSFLSDLVGLESAGAKGGVLTCPPNKVGENGAKAGARKGSAATRGRQRFAFPKEHYPVSEAVPKIGADLQASGEAVYVDDIPVPTSCLYAAVVGSPVALGALRGVDYAPALASPGVVACLDAASLPEGGQNVNEGFMGPPEQLFATNTVEFMGHPVAIVVADSYRHAKEAASRVAVAVDTAATGPPVLSIEDAAAREAFFPLPPFLAAMVPKRGDFAQAFDAAERKIEGGEVFSDTQQHFYLEPHSALALPDEGGTLTVYSSTQNPDGVQKAVARCLGLQQHAVRVITRRLGGSFGAKCNRANQVAVFCALAAYRLKRPVRMALDRNTDMALQGGRHAVKSIYDVGFAPDGRIAALRVRSWLNAGFSVDFSSWIPMAFGRALVQYDWGALDLHLTTCKTNLSSKTAMRAPGEVQGSFLAETIIEHVAAELGLPPLTVRERNLLTPESLEAFFPGALGSPENFTLPRVWGGLKESASLEARAAAVARFNEEHRWRKRGLAITPALYKIMLFGKPSRVSIFTDGSVAVEEGGVEMGQGLWTKVQQTAVYALNRLWEDPEEDKSNPTSPAQAEARRAAYADRVRQKGIPLSRVRIVDQDSISLANADVTAGSTTSEVSCESVRLACEVLVERLRAARVLLEKPGAEGRAPRETTWEAVVGKAKQMRVDLSASAVSRCSTPAGRPGGYCNFGAAVSEVEVDVLTGASTILRCDLAYDCGKSLNPAVDIGQIEGAFVMGVGFYTSEEVLVDASGRLVSDGTWEYKPPTFDTIPRELNVELLQNAPNSRGILSSKASGEPPLLLAASVHMAIRNAVAAARADRHLSPSPAAQQGFFRLDAPATMERIKAGCGAEAVERYLETLATGGSH